MKFPAFKDLIIYEDEDILLVNKPSGLPSLDDRSGSGVNLYWMARDYDERLHLCHRLDRDTSGALIVSKSIEAYKYMSTQFEKREVKKTYHAVVKGVIEYDHLEVNLPIKVVNSSRVRIDSKLGKPAQTIFNTLKNYKHFTLLECNPISGRTHQIRIHLASQNTPIVADTQYGGEQPMLSAIKKKFQMKQDEEEQPMIKRFPLHAFRLQFLSPSGESLDINAPYPKDFDVLLKLLERYDS